MSRAPWQRALSQRWAALQPRERLGLQVALGVLVLALLWLATQPAWQTLRLAQAQRQQLEAQLQRMHTLGAQATMLKAAAQQTPVRWREELTESLANLGQAELSESAGTLRVQLKACSAQELGRWLAALGPRWRLQVSQASLRSDAQGLWQGQITLLTP